MKLYIGASKSNYIFSWLIRKYIKKSYNHIYTRYEDPFTKQAIISESSHGEAHKMLIDKWYARGNRIVEEYEIDCTEMRFRGILSKINDRLQAPYSGLNIIGVLIYDLGEKLNINFIKNLANLFKDGAYSTICSESAAFTLRLFGVQFNRPLDFVRPDHIITKLEQLSKTEEYINKVKI